MMCEEEAMYQMYFAYLAKKASEPGANLTAEERSFLQNSGFQPAAGGAFACDPAPASEDSAVAAVKPS
jgi:hypothetical protein